MFGPYSRVVSRTIAILWDGMGYTDLDVRIGPRIAGTAMTLLWTGNLPAVVAAAARGAVSLSDRDVAETADDS